MASHHDNLLGDLVRFVSDASHQLAQLSSSTHTHSEETVPPRPPRLEIPTAVVVVGITLLS